ncbi:MAG: DNA topoisomerase IB [Pirellulales bacterium]|nr:DNA topoisomerase IB [Pirellulales bacterium]
MPRRLTIAAALEPAELAKLARLRYVADSDPGLTRRRNGKGFVYVNSRGTALRDPRKIQRIESLVIPPAWRDVWICAISNGHLQATGRDARKRKQYLYHQRWQHIANLAKFARMGHFAELLPKLRRKIAAQVASKKLTRESVLASIVELLDLTGIRVGNDEYATANDSYGLTTLRDRHVVRTDAGVELHFRGKGGVRRDVLIEYAPLGRFVESCAAIPGRRLFQCVDGDDKVRPVQSTDVNEFLQEMTGESVTAKDFRTWKASAQAAAQLLKAGPQETKTARKRVARQVVCEAAELLSNTPTVCRTYYIHPGLLESFEQGTFAKHFTGFSTRRLKWLSADEQVLAHFLAKWKPTDE